MGLLDSLVRTESGGNWGAQNAAMGAGGMPGHFGRLQFGQARLRDAMNAGVIPPGTTPQAFMADPAMQQRVEGWHFADIDRRAAEMGLGQYIGQTVGGIPITQDAIRAMAHLGGIGGAAAFLNSGGEINPSDVNGTSLADYARIHGGAGGLMAQQAPAEAHMSAQNQPARPNSLWDRLAGRFPGNGVLAALSDPDRRARAAIALEGMTLNPNVGLVEMLNQDITERRDTRRLQGVAEFLTTLGRTDLAEAVAAGALDPQTASAMALTPPEPVMPVEINGQLVDPTTGQVIGDYRDAQGMDQTAAIQNYEFMIQNGVDPATAQELAFGSGGVTVENNIGNDAPAIGTIPAGYEAFQDETGAWQMRAIPGGPEDTSANDAAAAEIADTSTRVIVSAADRARQAAQDRTVGGILSQFAAMNPGSQNAEVYRQIDVLRANARIEALQAMREASPTGGALGAVSDSEGAMLAAKAGALDPASPTFQRDLDDYELTLLQVIHGDTAGRAIFDQTRSGAEPSAATPATPEAAAAAPANRFSGMGLQELEAIVQSGAYEASERDALIARLRELGGG